MPQWPLSGIPPSSLNYTITTTPDLISGPPPVTTSTNTTILINYNTDYTITITACFQPQCREWNHIRWASIQFWSVTWSVLIFWWSSFLYFIFFLIVNCSDPSPVAGVTFSPFSDTTEGANISSNGELGLEPQRDDVSVCSSNGSWVPDPTHRICSTPPPSDWNDYLIGILYYNHSNIHH